MSKELEEKIEEILTRGVENVFPSKEALKKILLSGKKLRIYTGIDPTGKLHLGHAVVLKKLRRFQDLRHEIIVLIGDFTARIGDPTDKLAARKRLSREEVKRNAADYKKHIGKILDLKKSNVRFLHNEEWTNKLKPEDMLELASYFTVSRLLERDMFQERIKSGKQIYAHEFLYPIFQAYDSVTMDVDMEIGGNDQTFNMLAGRTLMKKMSGKEKSVLTTKLLTDPTGKKMGKTEGNVVNLDDKAEDMFGKIMSWPDNLIIIALETCTDTPLESIKKMEADMKSGKLNPRNAKLCLAHDIVKIYHGEKAALTAQKYFIDTFSKGKMPTDIPEVKIKNIIKVKGGSSSAKVQITKLLVKSRLAESMSDARRKIEQGGVSLDGEKIADWMMAIGRESDGKTLKVGKYHFVKIKFE